MDSWNVMEQKRFREYDVGTAVGRLNMFEWKWSEDDKCVNAAPPCWPCDISWSVQTSRQHVITQDLLEADRHRAVEVARYWRETVWRRSLARTRKVK